MTQQVKKIIFFDDIVTTDKENNKVIFVTDNVKIGMELREKGVKVYFLEEFFSKQDIEKIDRDCLLFIELILKSNKEGIFLEYALTPFFIRIFKILRGLELLFNKFNSREIIVIKSGDFTKIVALYLNQKSIPFKLVRLNFFKDIFNKIKKIESGKETKWINSGFRNFILEPFWLILLIFISQARKFRRKIFSFSKQRGKKLLVFTGDRFTLPVYQKLKDNKEWQFVLAGKTYPGRKLFMGENIPWLEEYISPVQILKFFKYLLDYNFKWRCFKKNFYNKFFYTNINFWNLSKNNLRNHFFITLPLMKLIYDTAFLKIFKKRRAILLMSNDVIDYNRALWLAAKESNIKSIVIQHGLLIEPNAHNKILVDKITGWGQASIEWYQRYGNDPSKIVVTGNPRFDSIPTIKSRENKESEKMILVGTDFVGGFSTDDSALKNFNIIKTVYKAVKGEKNIKVVVKIHPGETLSFYKNFLKRYPEIIITKIDFYELLNSCDIFVSSYSTTILEAAIFKKPVILFKNFPKRDLVPFGKWGVAKEVRDEREMREAILQLINNSQEREIMRNNQEKFVKHYALKIDGKATERVLNLMNNLYERTY